MAAAAEVPLKAVFIGDGAVGKTFTLIGFVHDTYPEYYYPSTMDNYNLTQVYDGKSYRMSFWDTAAQDDYDRLRPLSYPQTDLFVICFSASSPDSYDHVRTKWIPEITHHCPGVPFMLLCCKSDLRGDESTVEALGTKYGRGTIGSDEGAELASYIGAMSYHECSALARDGIKIIPEEIIKAYLKGLDRPGKNQKKPLRRKGECSLL